VQPNYRSHSSRGLWIVFAAIALTLGGSFYVRRSNVQLGNPAYSVPPPVAQETVKPAVFFPMKIAAQGVGALPKEFRRELKKDRALAPYLDQAWAKWIKIQGSPPPRGKGWAAMPKFLSKLVDGQGKDWPFIPATAGDAHYVLIPKGYEAAPSELKLQTSGIVEMGVPEKLTWTRWTIKDFAKPARVVGAAPHAESGTEAFGFRLSATKGGVDGQSLSIEARPVYKAADPSAPRLKIEPLATTFERVPAIWPVTALVTPQQEVSQIVIPATYPSGVKTVRVRVTPVQMVRVKRQVVFSDVEIENRFGQAFIVSKTPQEVLPGVVLNLVHGGPPPAPGSNRIIRHVPVKLVSSKPVHKGSAVLQSPLPSELGFNLIFPPAASGTSGPHPLPVKNRNRLLTFAAETPVQFTESKRFFFTVDLEFEKPGKPKVLDLALQVQKRGASSQASVGSPTRAPRIPSGNKSSSGYPLSTLRPAPFMELKP